MSDGVDGRHLPTIYPFRYYLAGGGLAYGRMRPNLRRRIGGRSVRRLAFDAASARAVTRSMGRSRPSLQRCAGQLTKACELSIQRYRSNGSSARLEASGALL